MFDTSHVHSKEGTTLVCLSLILHPIKIPCVIKLFDTQEFGRKNSFERTLDRGWRKDVQMWYMFKQARLK